MPAVWHKEILYALSKGIRVLGASSMGALRAAEHDRFGMQGVGRIYEAYRDGILVDDDEVAVAHATAEFDYRPVSDPMVNIRDAVRQACERSLITAPVGEAIIQEARRMYYPERSWAPLAARSRQVGLPGGSSRRAVRLRAGGEAEPEAR